MPVTGDPRTFNLLINAPCVRIVTRSIIGNVFCKPQFGCRKYNQTVVKARNSTYSTPVSLITLPSVTRLLPSRQIDRTTIEIPQNITLVNPEFYKRGKIDVLLGNTLFFSLLSSGQIRLNKSIVILQKTRLGWIVIGETNLQSLYKAPTLVNSFHVSGTLDKTLNKCWKVDNFRNRSYLSEKKKRLNFHLNRAQYEMQTDDIA